MGGRRPKHSKLANLSAQKVSDLNVSLGLNSTPESVGLGERIVLGNFCQADSRFSVESRGSQCTPISCVALVYNFLIPYSRDGSSFVWKSTDLDSILTIGDNLYLVSKTQNPTTSNCLFPDEVYPYVEINGQLFHFHSDEVTLNDLNQLKFITQTICTIENLTSALSYFSSIGVSNLLFTCNQYTFAVILSNQKFSFVDSHSRNSAGFVAKTNGVAVFLHIRHS